MIKEYLGFIKNYLKLAELKFKHLFLIFLTAIFYKGFSILLPFISSIIIKYLTLNSDLSYLYLLIFFICYSLYTISLYLNYEIFKKNACYCYNKLNKKILNKLVNVDNNFTRSVSKARLMNSINYDIIIISEANDKLSEIIIGLVQILLIFIIVSFYSIYISVILIIFSLLYIILKNSADRKINYYHNKVVDKEDKYSNLINNVIHGLHEVKSFNIIEKLNENLFNIQKKFNKEYKLKRYYYDVRDADITLVVYLFRFVLYLILIYFLYLNKIDISILILIISYHEYLVSYLDNTLTCTSSIREVNTYVRRVNDILNYNSSNIIYGDNLKDDVFGIIEFRNVSLNIKGKNILNNINLKINHNEVVCITGESGSGKTMLINLLLRLYKPNKGSITLDNINIYDFSKEIYLSTVSIVNNRPFIFNTSIRKNLNLVEKDITKQINACKLVGIHNFIEKLPDGYNTIIRENSNNITNSQKQLISFARSILTESEIIILDDITCSLNFEKIDSIIKLINKLKKDKTIIIISKKQELLKISDKVVLLDSGTVSAIGTHKELIKNNVLYQNLLLRKSSNVQGDLND